MEVSNEMEMSNEKSESEFGSDRHVDEVMSQLCLLPGIVIETSPSAVHEEELVRDFLLSGCGCLKCMV